MEAGWEAVFVVDWLGCWGRQCWEEGSLFSTHPPTPACLPLLSLSFTHSVPCCPGGIWLVLPSILFLADILLFREKRKKGTWLSRSPELFSQPPPQEASVISIWSLRFSELWQVG